MYLFRINKPIYCYKCKKKTSNSNTITAQTSNGCWRVSAQCLKCKTSKNQFIKAPEDKLLLAEELYKPVRIHFQKISILTMGINDLWAADLIDMKKYSEENEGYLYLLNVIDTFSKFVRELPIKKKDSLAVSKAFEIIIIISKPQQHKSPNLLHTAKGPEFENKHLNPF